MLESQATRLRWAIEIARAAEEPLGLVLDLPALTVRYVSPGGAACRWNRANPERAIEQGDRIVQVNGQRSALDITRAFQDAALLRLVLTREILSHSSRVSEENEGVASAFVQDLLEAASLLCEDEEPEGDEPQAWEVEPPDESQELTSPAPGIPPAGSALAASPYAVGLLPEGKPRHRKTKRRPPWDGYRVSCLAPDHEKVPSPPNRQCLAPLPPPPALDNVPDVKPSPMPDWMLQEARMLEASRCSQPPPPSCSRGGPQLWPQPPSPPMVLHLQPGIKPSMDLHMYSGRRERTLPRGQKHYTRARSINSLASPLQGDQASGHVTGNFCWGGRRRQFQTSADYHGQLEGGEPFILPQLTTEDKIRAWREHAVNNALCLARTCDVPLGLLPKMGALAI